MSRVHGFVLIAAAAAALIGCGPRVPEPVDSAAAQTSSTATRPALDPAPVVVDVRLDDGRIEPFPRRLDVAMGTRVILRVASDTATEVHVHGYDLSCDVTPGVMAQIEFVADRTGVFEVEAHPDTLLFQLAVR